MRQKRIFASLITLSIYLVFLSCSDKSKQEQTPPAIDVSLAVDSTKAYVLVRGAQLLKDTSFVSQQITVIDFGDKITVLERHNDWLSASSILASDTVSGFIHISQVTGNEEAIDAIRETGLLSRRILCSNTTDLGKTSLFLFGFDKKLRYYPINDTSSIRPLTQPGDAVWIDSETSLKNVNDSTLIPLGVIGNISSLKPKTLYCLTQTMDLKPFGEALAEVLLDSTREIPGLMAFRTPPDVCSKPIDAAWVFDGKALAVIDSIKGLVLLKVDPLRHAYLASPPIQYSGEIPTCILDLSDKIDVVGEQISDKIVVGWQGEKNTIRGYVFEGRILKESDVIDIKYKPTSLCRYIDNVFVGTKEGNLLWTNFDFEEKIFVDKKVLDAPIVQVEVKDDDDQDIDDDVFVASGSSGFHILQTASDTINTKYNIELDVEKMLVTEEGGLLLAGEQKGLWWYPYKSLGKSKAIPLSNFEEIEVVHFAQNIPPIKGLRMSADVPESPSNRCVVLAYNDSIHVLKGHEFSKLKTSHSIDLPAQKLIWGVDMLAVLTSTDIWFVSYSEILPSDYGRLVVAFSNEDFRRTEGGVSIYNADFIGTFIASGASILDTFEENFRKKSLHNRFTIVLGDNRTIIPGWIFVKNGKLVSLSTGTLVTIGKDGATVFKNNYDAGDIIEIGENGKPVLVGRWPGSGKIKATVDSLKQIASR